MDGLKQAPPKVKTFSCLQCGGPVTQRGLLQTTSIVCPSCGAVIDISDENMRVLSTFVSKAKVTPAIPLGARGTFPDGVFEVIGFMRRFVKVEGVSYYWREYLLFNPYKGFRWLSEYNGHWNYIKTTYFRPKSVGTGHMIFKGVEFRHFQSAQASVDYVIGEFPWIVQAGESCLVQDFVAPPQILSREQTDNEVTYSVGHYVEPEQIAKAFKMTSGLPARIGAGASQPSPVAQTAASVLRLSAILVGIAVLIQVLLLVASQNKLAYTHSFAFDPAAPEKSVVSDVFELSGHRSNVLVRSNAIVNNNWIYLSMALINDDTGTAYDFGRELGYYYGSDSDGSWSEGAQSDDAFLPAIPAGHYYLRIEPEGVAATSYSVRIYRDVPRWWLFLLTVGLLLLPAIVVLWRRHSFEYLRWSESDHPMMTILNTSKGDDE